MDKKLKAKDKNANNVNIKKIQQELLIKIRELGINGVFITPFHNCNMT